MVDDGAPRNAAAARMHGHLGHEGRAPEAFVAIGREEVRRYGAQVVSGRALDVERVDVAHLRVHLSGGHAVVARRLVIATGLADLLPPVDGLAELWGDRVIHCPFCHGYEFRDRRIVHLVDRPLALHASVLYRQLTDDLTIVVDDGVEFGDDVAGRWSGAGVGVVRGSAARVIATPDQPGATLVLTDGRRLETDAVAVATHVTARVDPFASIGIVTTPHVSGIGDVVATDAAGATGAAGVYAAGNVTDPSHQVVQASANGSWVGAMVAFDLAEEDLGTATRPDAVAVEWDHRYGSERVWSGNPNGALVAEVATLSPGRALDVGAGEGGDAIWLAERGWAVTAADISARALDRLAAAADARGLSVECLRGDANDPSPYPSAAFDLVTAHYASIPRTPDDRAIANLLGAVAPGGTLLVVNHDPEAMRAPVDVEQHSRGFDVDGYVRTADVVEHLRARADWEIVTNETRPRPPGAASASHHVDDVVLRARRRPASPSSDQRAASSSSAIRRLGAVSR